MSWANSIVELLEMPYIFTCEIRF